MSRATLESWDEIAAHCKVAVRTVQAWEKEGGLPVHRRGKGAKPRVFAYIEELEAWLQSQETSGARRSRLRRHRRAALLAGVLVVLASIAASWFFPLLGPPTRVEREGSTITVFDEVGRVCWTYSFPLLSDVRYAQYGGEFYDPGRHDLVGDIDGDGRREILFVEHPANWSQDTGTLYCFEENGALRWQFPFGRERRVRGRVFPNVYDGYLIGLVRRGEKRYLVAHAMQQPNFPDQVVLLDPKTGSLLDEYWHPGRVYAVKLFDLDGDGTEELLLGAANNPDEGLGHAALIVLALPFDEGAVETPEYFGDPGGKERAYILFPRPTVFSVTGNIPAVFSIGAWDTNRIQVEVGNPASKIIYHFDHQLRFQGAFPSDDLMRLHLEQYQDGKIRHPAEDEKEGWNQVLSFPAAPDGNSPEIKQLFQAAKSNKTPEHSQ